MDTFEVLLEALEAYSDINAEYKKARAADAAAYGQGYFSSLEASKMDRAKKQLREALDNHIQHVVNLKEV